MDKEDRKQNMSEQLPILRGKRRKTKMEGQKGHESLEP